MIKKIPISKDIYKCLNRKRDCGVKFRPTINRFDTNGGKPYCIECGDEGVILVGRATGKRPVVERVEYEGGCSEPLGITL